MHPALKQLRDERSTPSFWTLSQALSRHLPLLDKMEETPQDSRWHAEGNVAIHTDLVLQEAHKLSSGLSGDDRLTLLLGALLHDIAKPLCTTTKVIDHRERIVAPRHPSRGCSWLSGRLLALGLPHQMLRSVLQLVATHHEPRRLVAREAPARAYHALARRVPLHLLCRLIEADIRGRHCDDQEGQLEVVELFGLFAEEFGAIKAPHQIDAAWREHLRKALKSAPIQDFEHTLGRGIRDLERGTIFSPEEALSRSHEDRARSLGKLWVTCGPSGAGKSTWISKNFDDIKVISLDAIRQELTGKRSNQRCNGQVRQLAKERLKAALRERGEVIWDATNLRRDFRDAIFSTGRAYGAHSTLVTFHCTPKESAVGNAKRTQSIPEGVLRRQHNAFEWPDPFEADRMLYIDAKGEVLSDSRRP